MSLRPYPKLRGECPYCMKSYDLEYREDEEDTVISLNRGDSAWLPTPVGWYMPAHRNGDGWGPCPTSFRLVHPGR